jgi:hypothetical protein
MSDTTTTTRTRDELLGAEVEALAEAMTIVSGQSISRGDVIGLITASSKGTIMTAGASDGSQNFYAVAAEDIDASGGDAVGMVYKTGMFVVGELTFGTSTTIADVDLDDAREKGCFFKTANY